VDAGKRGAIVSAVSDALRGAGISETLIEQRERRVAAYVWADNRGPLAPIGSGVPSAIADADRRLQEFDRDHPEIQRIVCEVQL
jgi:hypothetical protein